MSCIHYEGIVWNIILFFFTHYVFVQSISIGSVSPIADWIFLQIYLDHKGNQWYAHHYHRCWSFYASLNAVCPTLSDKLTMTACRCRRPGLELQTDHLRRAQSLKFYIHFTVKQLWTPPKKKTKTKTKNSVGSGIPKEFKKSMKFTLCAHTAEKKNGEVLSFCSNRCIEIWLKARL